MSKIKTILGDNIRSLRTGKGWTQVYLADRLQITAPFLAQIEAGKRGMSLELIDSVAELFEIPVASLFIEHFPSKQIKRPEIRTIGIQTIKNNYKKRFLKTLQKHLIG